MKKYSYKCLFLKNEVKHLHLKQNIYLSNPLSKSTMSKFLILREKYKFIIIDTDMIMITETTKFVGDIEGTR